MRWGLLAGERQAAADGVAVAGERQETRAARGIGWLFHVKQRRAAGATVRGAAGTQWKVSQMSGDRLFHVKQERRPIRTYLCRPQGSVIGLFHVKQRLSPGVSGPVSRAAFAASFESEGAKSS